MTQTEIIQAIEAMRKEIGISYERLGKSTGVSQQAIRNTLKQKNSPNLKTLLDIAEALGMEVIVKQVKK